jgi:hypothetical protein
MRADASTRDERPFPGDPTAAIEQAALGARMTFALMTNLSIS